MHAARLWVLCFLLALSPTAAAGDWSFTDCATALQTPDFQPLRAALERTGSGPATDAESCLALAPPREYVVQTSWQLYYCDVASNAGCVNHRDGWFYPNLTFVQRIVGSGNKQFLLFNNRVMRRGLVSSGYHVFQLVPKSRNPRGYEFYRLAVGDHYFSGEGDLPPCRNLAAEDEAVEVRSVSVVGEGSRNVTLQFVTFVTPCSGGESSERTVEFKVVDGVLQKAPAA